jgi:hypothetical protein
MTKASGALTPDEMPFEPGELVVHRPAEKGERANLGILSDPTWNEKSGQWNYWLTYVQFPERGHASGGSSGMWSADKFRRPETADEVLLALQYTARAKARRLAEELTVAESEAESVDTTVRLRFGDA